MKDFKKYYVWKLSFELVDQIYNLIDNLPASEKFGIISQMGRASVSVPSNIAEGASRSSQKDFKRFLEIALGSLFELETLLLIVQRRNWLDVEEIQKIIDSTDILERKLGSLISKIKTDNK